MQYVDINSSALFAVKHVDKKDWPVVVGALPRKTVTFVTEMAFKRPVEGLVLKAGGAVPLYVALREKPSTMPATDVNAYRTFYRTLDAGGWVAYAPEATQVPNAVGETIFPQMLMKAAQLGHRTYLVGLSYGKTIDVRIEPYDGRLKPREQVVREMTERFARLSGLEQKLGVPLPT